MLTIAHNCKFILTAQRTENQDTREMRSHQYIAQGRYFKSNKDAISVKFHIAMKMYFGFTVAGDRSAVVAARKIVGLLLEMGHEVLTRHLVEDDAWEKDRVLTPREVYLRDMNWLDHCDAFVAEVSGSSFGVGFETGYLLGATSKKVVLFYRREAEAKISLLITGITHPNCTLVPYSDLNEVALWIRRNLSHLQPSPLKG